MVTKDQQQSFYATFKLVKSLNGLSSPLIHREGGQLDKNWLFDLIHVITRHISGSMLWKHQIRVFIVKTEETERFCRNFKWHRYCDELLLPFMGPLWCFRRDCAVIILIIGFWDNTFGFYRSFVNKLLFKTDFLPLLPAPNPYGIDFPLIRWCIFLYASWSLWQTLKWKKAANYLSIQG